MALKKLNKYRIKISIWVTCDRALLIVYLGFFHIKVKNFLQCTLVTIGTKFTMPSYAFFKPFFKDLLPFSNNLNAIFFSFRKKMTLLSQDKWGSK